MSSVYSTEPQTNGRVLLETTYGSMEIHLFSRECPMMTKLFLQLCTDGYYNNMIFHRIIPSLLIQTGSMKRNDKTTDSKKNLTTSSSRKYHHNKKSQQQQSNHDSNNDIHQMDWTNNNMYMKQYMQYIQSTNHIIFERCKYEINQRLRFHHRGQVAMALPIQQIEILLQLQQQQPSPTTSTTTSTSLYSIVPQFFITTEECDSLNDEYIIFVSFTFWFIGTKV